MIIGTIDFVFIPSDTYIVIRLYSLHRTPDFLKVEIHYSLRTSTLLYLHIWSISQLEFETGFIALFELSVLLRSITAAICACYDVHVKVQG